MKFETYIRNTKFKTSKPYVLREWNQFNKDPRAPVVKTMTDSEVSITPCPSAPRLGYTICPAILCHNMWLYPLAAIRWRLLASLSLVVAKKSLNLVG